MGRGAVSGEGGCQVTARILDAVAAAIVALAAIASWWIVLAVWA